MVRKAQPQAISATMYRHFAMLTLAVTGAVALFADGENREALASEVARPAKPVAPPPNQLSRSRSTSGGSFGSEFDGGFGEPMDQAGATARDGIIPGEFVPAPMTLVPAGFSRYGVSAEDWARLSDEQKRALTARHQAEQAAAKSPERAEQAQDLLAASRARSGQATAVE